MVWQADKPDLPTVAEAKAMSGATEKCEDSADVAVGSVSIPTRCRLCSRKESLCIFMYFYELINVAHRLARKSFPI